MADLAANAFDDDAVAGVASIIVHLNVAFAAAAVGVVECWFGAFVSNGGTHRSSIQYYYLIQFKDSISILTNRRGRETLIVIMICQFH